MANYTVLDSTGAVHTFKSSGASPDVPSHDLATVGGTAVALGQTTMSASLPVALASDQGNVPVILKGNYAAVAVTPAVTAGAYSAKNVIGGIQTIAGAAAANGAVTRLESLTISDKGDQKAAMDIYFFSSNPAAGTFADHGAVTWSTDITKVVGVVHVASADYSDAGGTAMAVTSERAISLLMVPTATSLFAVAVVTGTPTPGSTSDLKFTYVFDQR